MVPVSPKLCGVEGCGLLFLSRGLCSKHYYRQKRHGRLDLGHETRFQPCTAPGCGGLQIAKGLCRKHYMKMRMTGTLAPLHNFDGKAKERNRARTAAWKKENWPKYKAYLAARKTHLKRATPKWADIGAIQLFYQNCPPGYHVDHVIPLNGRTVSGLHVLPNLQYLPAVANLRKGNRFAVQQETNGE